MCSGFALAAAWLTTLLTFAVFAASSLGQAWVGQASCGCFGQVQVNPWSTLALDVSILLLLIVTRPPRSAFAWFFTPESQAGIHRTIVGGSLVAVLLASLAGVGVWWFGSTSAALAYLRGERVSASPSTLDYGVAEPGEKRPTELQLINRTDRDIRIIGGTSDCSCVTTDDLPLVIPARQAVPLTVRVKFPSGAGQFTRQASLYTDDPLQPWVNLRLSGRSMPAAIARTSAND